MRIFSSQTKTTFRRRSNTSKRFRYIFGLCFVAVIALVLLRDPLGTLASYATAPVYAVRTWFTETTWSVPVYFRTKDALIRERDALAAEVASRKDEEAQIAQLLRDNETLGALLALEAPSRVAAGVIMRPNATPYDTLLVDRGTHDGVVEGALVFADANTAIGIVGRAFPESAVITLFSTPGVRVPAYIFGPDTFAEAEGRGGGVLRIGVPQGVALREGDAVIVPSASPGILGRVAYIESDESNPEQYAFVPMSVSLSSLRYVAIDTRAMPRISYEEALEVVEGVHTTLHATTSFATSSSATSSDVSP